MHLRREVMLCPVWGSLLASTETLDGMTHERLARALVAQDGGAKPSLWIPQRPPGALPPSPFARERARPRLQARASRARPARGLLVGGEEVGTSRHATADAAPLGVRALGWWIANLVANGYGVYAGPYLVR